MFRLLVVALLLPAAASIQVMRGVEILNHRAMCTGVDRSLIPLKQTSIWLHQSPSRESTQHLKEWRTDNDGYVRDNTLEITGHALFNGETRLMYHVHCATYGPLCPGVAESCKDPKMLSTMSDQYVVIPLVWDLLPNPSDWEKFALRGAVVTIGHPGSNSYTISSNDIPPAPSSAMITSGDLARQITIRNHRAMCRNADGVDIPLADQFLSLHEDTEPLFFWRTDGDGRVRSITSVHHNRAKWGGAGSKTRIHYYVNCAKYGPICPGVRETCKDVKRLDETKAYVVLPFIWELPNDAQKYLDGGWGSIGFAQSPWNMYYGMYPAASAKPKRGGRAMRKMLQ